MSQGLLKSVGEIFRNAFTSKYERIEHLAKDVGFEIAGRCCNMTLYPMFISDGETSTNAYPLCSAIMLKRQDGETIIIRRSENIFYNGKTNFGEKRKLRDVCLFPDKMSLPFSEHIDLDFQEVVPEVMERYLKGPEEQ